VRVLAVVPAYRAERSVGRVVRGLRESFGARAEPVIVVDDGSDDGTSAEAERVGALVVRHERNRGKGAALRTGFARALAEGADAVVTVDADGQHPAEEARKVADAVAPREALVLGVRDLVRDGAPGPNRFSNAFSNRVLSWFAGRKLADTQCGLRRYPLPEILELGATSDGYAFEAEAVLRSARLGRPIEEIPIRVVYPPAEERTTHFRSVRDPARIVFHVVRTVLTVPHHARRRFGALRLLAIIIAGVVALLTVLHLAAEPVSRLTPPSVAIPSAMPVVGPPGFRRVGSSYVIDRGSMREVGLSGDPQAIGYTHARLLRDDMIENEGELFESFEVAVPNGVARTLLVDLARYRYRTIDRQMSAERLGEIAAGALAFAPDPYEGILPTYQRFVYLNALYDISLSFEHSPLVGCTTVVFHGEARPLGGAVLGRNFDMEAGEIFDRKKAVFLVRGAGKIAFASVAWPGLVGVVSGMNAAGVAVVVHGARAGEPRTTGEPVVHALRRVLEKARTTEDAVRLLGEREPLVSHLVVVADRAGDARAVERIPGQKPWSRPLGDRSAVTNHFEGPARDDPRNVAVLANTSSRARRERADELVRRAPGPVEADRVLTILRDKKALGDKPLPPGDRRAIDAAIATHAVLFDTLAKVMWVSQGPHLRGQFLAFDLEQMLADDYEPTNAPLPALAAE
jgi:hypothetical protein